MRTLLAPEAQFLPGSSKNRLQLYTVGSLGPYNNIELNYLAEESKNCCRRKIKNKNNQERIVLISLFSLSFD